MARTDKKVPPYEVSSVAVGWATVGGLLVGMAALLLTPEAKGMLGHPVLNDILAGIMAVVGIALFSPLVGELRKTLPNLKYAAVILAMLLVGGAIGFTLRDLVNSGPRDPTALVRPYKPQLASAFMQANQPMLINIGVINKGPAVARNLRYGAGLKVFTAPTSSTEETAFLDEFATQIDASLRHSAVAPGEGDWTTLSLTLNDEDATAIRAGAKRMYLLIKFMWEDTSGAHVSEECLSPHESAKHVVWHYCDSTSHIYLR